jgi:hypothetical protein
MGVPVKISIKSKEGKAREVFLCCKGCEKEARKDEAKTAERVEELNIQGNLAQLPPEDRKLAQAQRLCATSKEPLGWMGVPEKIVLKDKDGKDYPVILCCGGCEKGARKDEAKTIAFVEDLKKQNAKAAAK